MNKERTLFYSPNYPTAFSEFSRRYLLAFELFRQSPLINFYQVISDFEAIDPASLILIHKKDYVVRLSNIMLGKKRDNQIPRDGLAFDLIATKGSELAVDFAFNQNSIAYHLGGGFHHASASAPGAYDYCNDVAYSAAKAIKLGADKVLIIDLDVHHANGTEKIFWNDDRVIQVSFHGSGIYPGTGLSQNTGGKEAPYTKFNLPLPAGTGDELYLKAVKEIILPLTYKIRPKFIIYQAGVDTHHQDNLGNLLLTLNGLFERDRQIYNLVCELGVGVTIIRGGGYNDFFSPRANINTLAAFAGLKAIFTEENIANSNSKIAKEVEKRIKFLKQIISQHHPI